MIPLYAGTGMFTQTYYMKNIFKNTFCYNDPTREQHVIHTKKKKMVISLIIGGKITQKQRQ